MKGVIILTTLIKLAVDIGNGFVKSAVNNTDLPLEPSLIDRQNHYTGEMNSNNQTIIDNLAKNLVINVLPNKALNTQGIFAIGKSALIGNAQTSFNIQKLSDKAHDDLTIILVLGMLALHYGTNIKANRIPNKAELNVAMTTNLPLVEFTNATHVNDLTKRYLNNTFHIQILNFHKPIDLFIHFEKVLVVSESIAGTLALIKDRNLHYRTADFYKNFARKYHLDKFTGRDINKMAHLVGIDIGEGTTDISVTSGKLSLFRNAMQFIDEGIGKAIQSSMLDVRQQYNVNVKNRQTYVEQMMKRNRQGEIYRELLHQNLSSFETTLSDKIQNVYAILSNEVDLIFFHGAGASIIHQFYADDLDKLLKQLDPFGNTKILWLDQQTAQWLNLEGLNAMLNSMFRKGYEDNNDTEEEPSEENTENNATDSENTNQFNAEQD